MLEHLLIAMRIFLNSGKRSVFPAQCDGPKTAMTSKLLAKPAPLACVVSRNKRVCCSALQDVLCVAFDSVQLLPGCLGIVRDLWPD